MRTCVIPLFLAFLLSVSFISKSQNKEQSGSKSSRKSLNGSTMPSEKKPADISECPVKLPINIEGYELVTPDYTPKSKANILRSTNTMQFDQIDITDIKLNIPAFKLFKNNKIELTLEGEQQFKELVAKIKVFLSTDNKGKPIELKISASASQIPTSFDPSKPNFNLRPDGSSIPGKTNIKNNYLLAQARAEELAKKLKHAFPTLNIINPNINEIQLGKEVWTDELQKKLSTLTIKKDKNGIEKLFEPFQKDQWVKVESTELTSISIKPESAKMYMVSTTPPLKTKLEGKEKSINTIFIVSKTTFDKIGPNKSFATIAERDRFLRKLNLKIFQLQKDSLSRWYLLSGKNEIEAFNTIEYKDKIAKLYKNGISDKADQYLIQKIIEEELAVKYKSLSN